MRILYFSFVELDVPNACQTHTLGVLTGFSANSCTVDAIIPRPRRTRPNISGVSFYYIWPWRFSSTGRLWVKTLGFLIFSILCIWNRYDAIYARELEANPFPRWCSAIFGIPLYIEVNSTLLQSVEETNGVANRLCKIEKNQRADFEQAKGLIVPSYPRCRWIMKYYGPNHNKVHLILNGSHVPVRKKIDRSTVLETLNLPSNSFCLGFLGNVWKSYDLITIMTAFELCQKQIQNLFLLIMGGGPDLENVRHIAKIKGFSSKIQELGYVQPDLLYKVMGAVDIGLMNLTKDGVREAGPVTTRFATYASFKIPVIANDTYMEYYPDELEQGLAIVPPEDPQALVDIILLLYNHPEERRDKAKILYDFFSENLTWESVTREILNIINHDKNPKRQDILNK